MVRKREREEWKGRDEAFAIMSATKIGEKRTRRRRRSSRRGGGGRG